MLLFKLKNSVKEYSKQSVFQVTKFPNEACSVNNVQVISKSN